MKKPAVYYFIFTISGFSGLIYESIWTHYLKLFLGHAAHAQTLVLAIFMGGMALGAWLCSRHSHRWHNLLYAYAVAEGVIGLFALAFHPLFDAGINYAYGSILPSIGSPSAATAFRWGVSTLSILPQSVLLGMTFPLMSGAFLRLFPESSGRSLAILYFSNSIGAVFGVLASGFLLIDLVGFPGTIGFAGATNIALAITVWFLSRSIPAPPPPKETVGRPAATPESPFLYRLLLLLSLGTGTASFFYEIGWIRMLSLVLGSSTHAFELMLGAFLLGLATGGIWIKKRIDTLADPIRFLAWIQLAMGIAALATLPLYNRTFPVMQRLVQSIPKSDGGYFLFNLSSYGIAAAIMLPATFCAGMTLPLITNILFRAGYGEKSIGAVYAANTVGAIIGIFGAVHLFMPATGLKGLLTSGAAIDMALAIILVGCSAGIAGKRLAMPFAGVCLLTVSLTAAFVHLDQYKMASGVYRAGVRLMSPENVSLLFHRDGKTATITVARAKNGITNIITNGKSDSAVNLDPAEPPAIDESTTILCGALPFFYHADARHVANIGLGTGLTSQTVLTNPDVRQVDTIEIERAVIDGARHFRSLTELVYSDRRSNIIVDDAKAVFSGNRRRYDVIISEPSNPWVSGVASLFSEEFYRHINRHLQDDGLFVQWLQLYESDMDNVASVFKALSKNFSDYSVFLTGGNADLMVVARKRGSLGPLDPAAFQHPALRTMLARINVNGLQDIQIRQLGAKKFLDPLFQSYPIKANSDYYPVLDQRVGKAKFMNSGAFPILMLAGGQLPFMPYRQLITDNHDFPPLTTAAVSRDCGMTLVAAQAAALRRCILGGDLPEAAADDALAARVRDTAASLRRMADGWRSLPEASRQAALTTAATIMLPYLTEEELTPVWLALESPSSLKAMTAGEKKLLDLLKALSARNFEAVSTTAGELLAGDRQLPAETRRYILANGMLSAIAAGNRVAARQLYENEFGSREPEDIIFRLLHAHARLQ